MFFFVLFMLLWWEYRDTTKLFNRFAHSAWQRCQDWIKRRCCFPNFSCFVSSFSHVGPMACQLTSSTIAFHGDMDFLMIRSARRNARSDWITCLFPRVLGKFALLSVGLCTWPFVCVQVFALVCARRSLVVYGCGCQVACAIIYLSVLVRRHVFTHVRESYLGCLRVCAFQMICVMVCWEFTCPLLLSQLLLTRVSQSGYWRIYVPNGLRDCLVR